ncbi:MAG: cation diffusion facilitator family transporter [Eubacteriaceae bacterium]
MEEDSQALAADALHLKTDVYTSLGFGVLLVKITGFYILDPIVAIMVALLIIKEAWHLTTGAFNFLIDVKLSDEEEAQVIEVIEAHRESFIECHKLKTRKAGNSKHIDFHITVPEEMSVGEAHCIIGMIKKDMNEIVQNTRISIHIEPNSDVMVGLTNAKMKIVWKILQTVKEKKWLLGIKKRISVFS